MAPIDLDRLRLRSRLERIHPPRPPGPAQGERFLKGPVPLPWLEAAARLPGKSLHAGIALWYAAGLARSAAVPLSNISGVRFGLDRNAKYRALAWLEDAGLITVERKLGRAPVVTLLPGPSS
jgi:hypothetical protein